MNRIKEVLKEQGRTQTWLAEQIGKSYVVVTNYCNNNAQPSIPVLRRIAEVLDVDVRELLVGTKWFLLSERSIFYSTSWFPLLPKWQKAKNEATSSTSIAKYNSAIALLDKNKFKHNEMLHVFLEFVQYV